MGKIALCKLLGREHLDLLAGGIGDRFRLAAVIEIKFLPFLRQLGAVDLDPCLVFVSVKIQEDRIADKILPLFEPDGNRIVHGGDAAFADHRAAVSAAPTHPSR